VSGSSDSFLNLWFVSSLSSGPADDDDDTPSLPTRDQLIKTYEEHDDSVYSVAWSAASHWMFASLSYDGRVVINFVPEEFADITKY